MADQINQRQYFQPLERRILSQDFRPLFLLIENTPDLINGFITGFGDFQ
jgi:hypothetical protein